ncbi:MAG: peptidylprolyl isomerase [Deltaproteobacteria bacterium]|nr:peptidylprolyl isomerase [Deltaproteobacteria bacterium]
MRVAADTVVTIEYVARLDDGTVVDSTERCGAISYLHGNEQVFPALERVVDGLEPGDARDVQLPAEEAYGLRREELIRRVPRAQLPPDIALVPGERYELRAPNATRLVFTLVGVEGDEVVADFNTRGAGQGLRITATVLGVRAATADEIRRGTLR